MTTVTRLKDRSHFAAALVVFACPECGAMAVAGLDDSDGRTCQADVPVLRTCAHDFGSMDMDTQFHVLEAVPSFHGFSWWDTSPSHVLDATVQRFRAERSRKDL